MTSSPESHSVANAVNTACLPPLVTSTWLAAHSKPLSRLVFTAMASRSSGRPAAGVYLWFFGSRHARTAASTMLSGVGESGSPAPKPMTFSPLAFKALALASTARVADSAMAARRADVRFTFDDPTVDPESGPRVFCRSHWDLGSRHDRLDP